MAVLISLFIEVPLQARKNNYMKQIVAATMPTQWGDFEMRTYADDETERMPHIAMVHPEIDLSAPVYLRIHSECITGDLFGSKRCDCGAQLHTALRIANEKKGAVIYLRQEGRNIGIINKLRAYNLQDEGLNTADANVHLGLGVDERNYDIAITIMKDIGIKSIHLLTNNPLKVDAIDASEIELVSRVPLVIAANTENRAYLQTKKDLMGHFLNGM